MLVVLFGLFIKFTDELVIIGLRGLHTHDRAAVKFLVTALAVVREKHRLVAWNGERGVPFFVGNAEHFVDGCLRKDRTGGIVNNDLVSVLKLVAKEEDSVSRGIMRGVAASDNPLYLRDLVFVENFFQVIDPVFYAYNDDAVDILVSLEIFESVDNDWLIVQGEKLLGHGTAHSLSDSAGKDDRNVLH